MSDHVKCSHPGGCDRRGTHRVVFVLLSGGLNPIARKCELTGERRCEAHFERDPEVFFSQPGWLGVWSRLAEQFGRGGFAKFGHVPIAIRERTSVHYVPEDGDIEDLPVMVVTPGGIEKDGTVRVRYDA